MNKQDYILLPGDYYRGKDLLIAKKKSLEGLSWKEAHIQLQEGNAFMLTPRIFFNFLKYLYEGKVYDGTGNRLPEPERTHFIQTIAEKGQQREEWLDMHFSTRGNNFYMDRVHVYENEVLSPRVRTEIEQTRRDFTPPNGVNLNSLILHPTESGLPEKEIPSGEDTFLHPRLDTVVSWRTTEKGRALLCSKNPEYPATIIEVRAVYFREERAYGIKYQEALGERAVA